MNARDEIIKYALDSPEGRTALADALIAPIKQSLAYQRIGGQLLMAGEPSIRHKTKTIPEYFNK